jgi:hypothetical protein
MRKYNDTTATSSTINIREDEKVYINNIWEEALQQWKQPL